MTGHLCWELRRHWGTQAGPRQTTDLLPSALTSPWVPEMPRMMNRGINMNNKWYKFILETVMSKY